MINIYYSLVLGSQSPRRSELLTKAGFSYEKRVIETDESYPPHLPKNQIAEHIAIAKAAAHLPTLKENEVILTADTIVVHNATVYGKPKDATEAVQVIKILSNTTHLVYTGVCIQSLNKQVTFSEKSEVDFGIITDLEIKNYVAEFKPMDKAGAYGIQDWIGFARIAAIRGSYTNILGLPLAQTYDALLKF